MRNTVRDGRRLPFFQVVKEDLAALCDATAAEGVSVKLSAVRSVYFALLEIANDERADETNVTRKALAERAGVSTRTCQEATAVLTDACLLEVEIDFGREGNTWVLTSPEPRQPAPDYSGSQRRTLRQPAPDPIEGSQEVEETTPTPLTRIFDHWQRLMAPRAVLDVDRRRTIERALRHSSLSECLGAINGCSKSDFHMARGKHSGENKQNHLSLILRNRETVERFIGMLGADDAGHTGAVAQRVNAAKVKVQQAHYMPNSETARQEGEAGERYLRDHGIEVTRRTDGRPTFRVPNQPGI